jgi:hypothetical protein
MANVAELSINGGHPEVEIVIGHLQRGDHLIVLVDRNNQNGVIVGRTNNGVPVAYRYQIPRSLSQLDENVMKWNCIIGTNTPGVAENASVTVRVIQDGRVVRGGEIITRKEILEFGVINDEVRLDVK